MIGNAVERNGFIYVYDPSGRLLSTIPAQKGLVGYTSKHVTVTNGSFNYIYDEIGNPTGTVPAK